MYEGTLNSDTPAYERCGQGKMTYADNGEVYEGEWENNKRHGNGKLLASNNTVLFEGKWENDEYCGTVVEHIALMAWLESLSLTEYYTNFTQEGYDDLETIGSMEENDLIEAG